MPRLTTETGMAWEMSAGGVPVYYPTSAEFANFSECVLSIERHPPSLAAGLAKIVPPARWSARTQGYTDADLADVKVRIPIEQRLTGRDDAYQIYNVERQSVSVPTFRAKVTAPEKDLPRKSDGSAYSDQEVDTLYWQTVTQLPRPVYGADVSGSLFDTTQTVWNVSKLGTLLDMININIPGVTSPYLYFGSWRATFAWHVEDMNLYSINYLHYGAPKSWYVVPTEHASKMEAAMQEIFQDDFEKCSEFLRHKMSLVSPTVLRRYDVPHNSVTHRQGEFIITFPYAYHSGFNHGFNIAESVNFALDRWIDFGIDARVCQCKKNSVYINMNNFVEQFRPAIWAAWCEEAAAETMALAAVDAHNTRVRKRKAAAELANKPVPTILSFAEIVRENAKSNKCNICCGNGKAALLVNEYGEDFGPEREVDKVVTCAGCSVSVHRICYGPATETKAKLGFEEWWCSRCVLKPGSSVACELCLTLTGAFVPTSCGKWAHVACAIAVPETNFTALGLPVEGIKLIPEDRWRLTCCVCRIEADAACVQCIRGKCATSAHMSCAQLAGWPVQIERFDDGRVLSLGVVCKKHHCAVEKPPKQTATVGSLVWSQSSDSKYYRGAVLRIFDETVALVQKSPSQNETAIPLFHLVSGEFAARWKAERGGPSKRKKRKIADLKPGEPLPPLSEISIVMAGKLYGELFSDAKLPTQFQEVIDVRNLQCYQFNSTAVRTMAEVQYTDFSKKTHRIEDVFTESEVDAYVPLRKRVYESTYGTDKYAKFYE